MKFRKSYLVIIFLFTSLFFIFSTYVSAFSVLDVLKGVGDAILGINDNNVKDKKFTIESTIVLAPDGDENNNGEIDAGDTITFTYTITNTTDKQYSYATLKTNIDRKQLNFIHNVSGVTGLADKDGTITFPNIRLGSKEQRIISFDARINYFTDDKQITTEPEFFTEDKQSVSKSQKKEVKANKLSRDEIKKQLKNKGILKNNSSGTDVTLTPLPTQSPTLSPTSASSPNIENKVNESSSNEGVTQ